MAVNRFLAAGLMVWAVTGCAPRREAGYAAFCYPTSRPSDGELPYGKITDNMVWDMIYSLREEGYELRNQLQDPYEGDLAALGRIFRYSLYFDKLDEHARTYGHLIFMYFVELRGTLGVEAFAKVIAAQDPMVRQRIRDFLYYPVVRVGEGERVAAEKQVRRELPEIFPKQYKFGERNPIFAGFGAGSERR